MIDKRVFSIPLVLASASPRRREILMRLGFSPEVRPAAIDEMSIRDKNPAELALKLARAKATAVQLTGKLTVAADTIVAIDSEILEKPLDKADARRMLTQLSGREHFVFTGVSVVLPGGRIESFVEKTSVFFSPLSEQTIEDYIETDESYDKAGAYGVQEGFGMANIHRIEGCYFNVMGFPASRFMRLLSANQKFLLS